MCAPARRLIFGWSCFGHHRSPRMHRPIMNQPLRPGSQHAFGSNLTTGDRAWLSWTDWLAGAMLLPALCLWSLGAVLPIEWMWSNQAAQQIERLMR